MRHLIRLSMFNFICDTLTQFNINIEMNEHKKSKLKEYLKINVNLEQSLQYPVQIIFAQLITTPFERLQILKQCEPSLIAFRLKDLFNSDLSLTKRENYGTLIRGKLRRDSGERKVSSV